jgi:hypothetical protein
MFNFNGPLGPQRLNGQCWKNDGDFKKVVSVGFHFVRHSGKDEPMAFTHQPHLFGSRAPKNPNLYSQQEVIPVTKSMSVRQFYDHLKSISSEILRKACHKKVFGNSSTMVPIESSLFTNFNQKIRIVGVNNFDLNESTLNDWSSAKMGQMGFTNYTFRTSITNYDGKCKIFDIMASLECSRSSSASSPSNDEKRGESEKKREQVVDMNRQLPCPHLKKLLSELGIPHHQDSLAKEELTLDLLLSIEPFERKMALACIPFGSRAILLRALNCMRLPVSTLKKAELISRRVEKEIRGVGDSSPKKKENILPKVSSLTKLIYPENGDVSIAARIASMLIPNHNFIFRVSKDFCTPNVSLGFEEDGRTFGSPKSASITQTTTPQGHVNGLVACNAEIEANTGVYTWAFAVRSSIVQHFATFGIASHLGFHDLKKGFKYPSPSHIRGFSFYKYQNVSKYQAVGSLGGLKTTGQTGSAFGGGFTRNFNQVQNTMKLDQDDIIGFELDTDVGELKVWINGVNTEQGGRSMPGNSLFKFGAVRPFVMISDAMHVCLRAVPFPKTPEQANKIIHQVQKEESQHMEVATTKLKEFGFEEMKIRKVLDDNNGVISKSKCVLKKMSISEIVGSTSPKPKTSVFTTSKGKNTATTGKPFTGNLGGFSFGKSNSSSVVGTQSTTRSTSGFSFGKSNSSSVVGTQSTTRSTSGFSFGKSN